MTAEAWVRQALATKITADEIVFPDQVVLVTDFCIFFGAAIEAALADGRSVYEALITETHTFTYEGEPYSLTAGEMGYTPYFTQWHTEGLI